MTYSLTATAAWLAAVRLLPILLFNVSTSMACQQVAVGQEKTIKFVMKDFKLPVEMAFSTNTAVQIQVPRMANSIAQAKRKIKNYMENLVDEVIRQKAAALGVSLADQETVISQIALKSSYEPMECGFVIVNPDSTKEYKHKSASGYDCFVVDNIVAGICSSGKCAVIPDATTTKPAELVPKKFLTYRGSIKISNAVLAGWDTTKWQQVLDEVQLFMEDGKYANSLGGATLREFEDYLSHDPSFATDPYEFWQKDVNPAKYPLTKKSALKYLSAPAISIECQSGSQERPFIAKYAQAGIQMRWIKFYSYITIHRSLASDILFLACLTSCYCF